ncbi:MAG: hypothetical protein WDW36_006096 [Sanguina aurantia]
MTQRRQRLPGRKREERITSLEEILQSLPAPGGMAALSSYESLHAARQQAAPVSVTDSNLHSASSLQPSDSPSHTIDWASMPSACKLGSHLNGQAPEAQGQVVLYNSGLEEDERGMMGRRVLRKRKQVESFLLLLNQILPVTDSAPLAHSVVEFGCGSGSLLLPLAFLLPGCHFHGVDIKDSAVVLLLARAKEAGLTNVSAEVGYIEDYRGPRMDVALALHACGSATDLAMLQAFRHRAAYIVSPCCVGKLKFSVPQTADSGPPPFSKPVSAPPISAAGLGMTSRGVLKAPTVAGASTAVAAAAVGALSDDQAAAVLGLDDASADSQSLVLTHPRSQWMRAALPQSSDDRLAAFLAISRAADISHSALHSHPHLAKLAKTNIELDRSMAAAEVGYHAALLQLLEPELHSSRRATDADKRALIDKISCFIFDCDGVIWRGDSVIDGVPETLDMLRSMGKKMVFVTNNSTKSRAGYLSKFTGLGLNVNAEEIYSSSYAAAAYLESINFKKKVYVIGEVGIQEELDLKGIAHIGGPADGDRKVSLKAGEFMHHDPDVGAVVVGFDRNINYYKIQYATLCIYENPGCLFIATNRDAVTHLTDAQEWAGNGAMVGAIVGSTKQEPIVVGKPAEFMLENIATQFGLEREQICMIGDRLDTDIMFGINGGLTTALVLSGVTTEETLLNPANTVHPDMYMTQLSDMLTIKPAAVAV